MTHEETKQLALWALGEDTGRSSEAIARAALTGEPADPGDMPCDADDFGRCYRLVQEIPGAFDGVVVNSQQGGAWFGLWLEWERLCGLWEAGDGAEIYRTLRQLNGY